MNEKKILNEKEIEEVNNTIAHCDYWISIYKDHYEREKLIRYYQTREEALKILKDNQQKIPTDEFIKKLIDELNDQISITIIKKYEQIENLHITEDKIEKLNTEKSILESLIFKNK